MKRDPIPDARALTHPPLSRRYVRKVVPVRSRRYVGGPFNGVVESVPEYMFFPTVVRSQDGGKGNPQLCRYVLAPDTLHCTEVIYRYDELSRD